MRSIKLAPKKATRVSLEESPRQNTLTLPSESLYWAFASVQLLLYMLQSSNSSPSLNDNGGLLRAPICLRMTGDEIPKNPCQPTKQNPICFESACQISEVSVLTDIRLANTCSAWYNAKVFVCFCASDETTADKDQEKEAAKSPPESCKQPKLFLGDCLSVYGVLHFLCLRPFSIYPSSAWATT